MRGEIKTFYSHQTEDLSHKLLNNLISDEGFFLNQPFGQCKIIVPNSGMQRYLELQIARTFGICSQITIGYLGGFLWQLYQQILPETTCFYLEERTLTFRLLALFEQTDRCPVALQQLLQAYRHNKQRYYFATRLAKLFIRYFVDRPELIAAWQAKQPSPLDQHPHSQWQRDIFQQLALGQYSRQTRQQQFQQGLAEAEWPLVGLPNTLHVFGFHAIAPSQLADLFALAEHCRVYCYTFNPCVEYWQDIVPEVIKAKEALTEADEANWLTTGNPLLASWGQAGKYYIEQLNQHDTQNLAKKAPQKNVDSVLSYVQQRLVYLDESSSLSINGQQDTESLSLHVVAGIRREIEVLYDNLLAWLESDTSLTPADILVMVPDLTAYAPHIEAVFSQQALPFSLANQTAADTQSDVQAFLATLRVISENFLAQPLFGFLSEPSIRQVFGLTGTHLNHIRRWFVEHRYAENYHDNSQGRSSSLEKLLEQLLLAYVGGEKATYQQRIASTVYQAGQQTETLMIFCQVIQRFLPFSTLSEQVKPLKDWFVVLSQLAEDFLAQTALGAVAVNEHLTLWYDSLSTQDEQEVSFEVVFADLLALFERQILHGPFLSGGISFCAMTPMRAIPAKVIAILGLSSDFPALATGDPFDLRQAQPRWSDHLPYKESRYFFLESVMSARERLYLSYCGIDEKTASLMPPSSLVNELLGFVERQFPGFAERATVIYPLQGFMSDACGSYQLLYEDRGTPSEVSSPVDQQEATEIGAFPTHWRIKDLVEAVCFPLAFYLSHRLKVGSLESLPRPLKKHVYLGRADHLDTWNYQMFELSAQLQQSESYPLLADANLAAPPAIDGLLQQQISERVAPLRQALERIGLAECQPLRAFITHEKGDETYTCLLTAQQVNEQGLWCYTVSARNAKRLMTAWVSHVLLNCLPETTVSRVQRQTTLLSLAKTAELETLSFRAFPCQKTAQQALADLFDVVQAVYERPYALEWRGRLTTKKDTSAYQEIAEPIYSGLNSQLITEAQALETLFKPVQTMMEAYCESI